ncbi:hypothetical protein MTsPCn9_06500 [Croceitalea sp. MTPC9]|uniref:histidine kinase n=1 Tax=unclassified Croceitalea TaxID=2632280 RepID=UPI002B3E005A|nr:hypothetical protein MTsPCn6_02210 [Croceitalea sp. MTPC6]GMN15714.1 hypothetical protein MTsPCn9_06500 [Croceitalea sp. MTPC9]
MKKLFIHNTIFRLLSPIFNGVLVYLLLLLINNTIDQLQETFIGQELYVCIILAYLIQEFSRLSLLVFKKLKHPKSFFARLLLQVLSSIIMTVILVSAAMHLYFKYVLSYTLNSRELIIFNSIFIFITIIYVILYLAHFYLHKVNKEKISREVLAKHDIEDDFQEFKRGINPDLLFESLEALIVLMKKDANAAEGLADNFSSIYRYIITKKNDELVPIQEEMIVLQELIELLNHLPYRKIELKSTISNSTSVVPTSLLKIIEAIVKSTVVSENETIIVSVTEQENGVKVSYQHEEKLRVPLTIKSLEEISKKYAFYTDKALQIVEKGLLKSIVLPKLSYQEII